MKKFILPVLVVLAQIFAILFLVEIGSRMFFQKLAPPRGERALFWEYDNLLGWRNKPNQDNYFTGPSWRVRIKTNSKGFRGNDYPLKRTTKKRMLILGDSFGWGFGVESEKVFTEILQKRHPDWEIINSSVSGYGTDQEFLYLKTVGINYHPDVVLLLFYGHDHGLRNTSSEIFWHYKPMFICNNGTLVLTNVPVPKSTLQQRVTRFLFGQTYFLRLLCESLNNFNCHIKHFLENQFSINHIADHDPYDGHHDYLDNINHITPRLLTEINRLSRSNNAQFILVSIPPMDLADRNTLKILSIKESFPYLALDESFSSVNEQTHLENDEHWNSKGHEVAANTIEEFLNRIEIF